VRQFGYLQEWLFPSTSIFPCHYNFVSTLYSLICRRWTLIALLNTKHIDMLIHAGLTDMPSQILLFANVKNEFIINLQTKISNNPIRPKLRILRFYFNVRTFVISVETCLWLLCNSYSQ
jgi:hypothetical protein